MVSAQKTKYKTNSLHKFVRQRNRRNKKTMR